MSKIKHSISLFVSILRNIYERDWYTPYSQRSKKWRCGWRRKNGGRGMNREAADRARATSHALDVAIEVLRDRGESEDK